MIVIAYNKKPYGFSGEWFKRQVKQLVAPVEYAEVRFKAKPFPKKIIITLGRDTTSKYIDLSKFDNFSSTVGYFHPTPYGTVVPCYHPTHMYSAPGSEDEDGEKQTNPSNKFYIERTLIKVDNYCHGYQDKPEKLLINNNPNQVLKYLDECLKAKEVCIDLETASFDKGVPDHITAVGISKHVDEALCFTPDMRHYDLAMAKLRVIMENPNIQKIGQNYINFDAQVLYWLYDMQMYGNMWDTLDVFKLLYPDLKRASLELQGAAFLYCEPWKDEAWRERGEKLRMYCAKDVIRTFRIRAAQERELKKQQNFAYYTNVVLPTGSLVARALAKGINFDHKERGRQYLEINEAVKAKAKELRDLVEGYVPPKKIKRNKRDNANDIRVNIPQIAQPLEDFQKMKRTDLNTLLSPILGASKLKDYYLAKKQDNTKYGLEPGFIYQKTFKEEINVEDQAFNPNSPSQVLAVFQNMGIDVPTKRKQDGTYGPSTGSLELRKIIFNNPSGHTGVKLAELLLEYKPLAKFVNSYLKAKFPRDGRWRSQFKLRGTETGRASSQMYFKKFCGNLQNIPSRGIASQFKKCFVPDPGYVWFNFDQNAAESRVVAQVAKCERLLKMFDEGRDFHCETARELVGVDADDKTIKTKFSEERSLAKPLNHGCLAGEEEILTKSGWVRIDAWEGQDIAVWQTSGSINFEQPAKYHQYGTAEGYRFVGNRIDTSVTSNHKFPNKTSQGNVINLTAEELAGRKTGRIPCSGDYSNGVNTADSRTLLEVALQADGRISHNRIVFHLRKQRKIDRLVKLLSSAGIEYSKTLDCVGDTYIRFDKSELRFTLVDPVSKEYKIEGLWGYDNNSLTIILDECFKWDGSEVGPYRTYRSAILKNCIFIQTLAHLVNQQACTPRKSSRAYEVRVANRKYIRRACFSKVDKITLPAVYCFTTSTGYFLTRNKKGIYVTGNSSYGMGSFVMQGQFIKSGHNISKEKVEQLMNKWHKAYPEIKSVYHKYVEDQLKLCSTLVNALGRRRIFLGQLGYKMYKQAYADIPQSTIPDISNLMWQKVAEKYNDEDAMVLIQTHDSLSGQVKLDLADEFKEWFIKAANDIELKFYDKTFNIPWDGDFGANYYEVK